MTRDSWRDDWKAIPGVCETWEGHPTELTLIGFPGRGKTHLAAIIFRRLFAESLPGECDKCRDGWATTEAGAVRCECRSGAEKWRGGMLWVDVPETIEWLKSHMGTPSYQQRIDAIRNAGLCVLDDAGSETGEWGKELVPGWIRWRYNQLLPTLVTCNAQNMNELRELDPRTASRLSGGLTIALDGRDRRAAR